MLVRCSVKCRLRAVTPFVGATPRRSALGGAHVPQTDKICFDGSITASVNEAIVKLRLAAATYQYVGYTSYFRIAALIR